MIKYVNKNYISFTRYFSFHNLNLLLFKKYFSHLPIANIKIYKPLD